MLDIEFHTAKGLWNIIPDYQTFSIKLAAREIRGASGGLRLKKHCAMSSAWPEVELWLSPLLPAPIVQILNRWFGSVWALDIIEVGCKHCYRGQRLSPWVHICTTSHLFVLEYNQCWSSCCGLIVLELRQGYVDGPSLRIGSPLAINNLWFELFSLAFFWRMQYGCLYSDKQNCTEQNETA
jgi:hypothetical protein